MNTHYSALTYMRVIHMAVVVMINDSHSVPGQRQILSLERVAVVIGYK